MPNALSNVGVTGEHAELRQSGSKEPKRNRFKKDWEGRTEPRSTESIF